MAEAKKVESLAGVNQLGGSSAETKVDPTPGGGEGQSIQKTQPPVKDEVTKDEGKGTPPPTKKEEETVSIKQHKELEKKFPDVSDLL